MELRQLRYFLAVARLENISRAAEELHISQPALSRQLQELEQELHATLLHRGKRSTTLTESGMLFRERAAEVVRLADKAESVFQNPQALIGGDIDIGCAESEGVRVIAQVAAQLQQEFPNLRFHLHSSDERTVADGIEKGMLDFGILTSPTNVWKYHYRKLPYQDRWCVFMRKDSELAALPEIQAADLWGKPLILPQQALANSELANWLGKEAHELHLTATYNLLYNASLLVQEGIGYAIGYDRILYTGSDSPLTCRPLAPAIYADLYLVWKKQQRLSKAAAVLRDRMCAMLPA